MKRALSLVLVLVLMLSLAVLPAGASSSVDEYISRMSTRQKVTQMLMMDFRQWKSVGEETAANLTVMNDEVRRIIEDYDFGAVICYGNNIKTTEDTFALTMAMQDAATRDGGVPLLIATDQEGGSVYRLGSGTSLPGNMALGATHDTGYAYEAGRIIGSELSSLGINVSLSPVVDVNSNANNPVIGLRSYSDDAATVGAMASSVIEGMSEYGVIGCAKHFPGHGDTEVNSHYGLPSVDKPLDVLTENELVPYKIAIAQGIDMVMTAHILYPQLERDTAFSEKTGKNESLPATMSDDIITGLLKGALGFTGIVCTDGMAMAGIADNWNEVQAVVNAIGAGADLICVPTSVHSLAELPKLDAVIDGVLDAVERGNIPESRLDDACRRILTVKANHGILDYDPADFSLEKAQAVVGCAENRATEREMAARAVTVIKNDAGTLPLKLTENNRVLMLTPYNNECAQLVMGWNRAKQAGLIPDGAQVKVVRYENKGAPYDISAYREDLDWADTVLINSEIGSSSYVKNGSWVYTGPRALLEYAVQNSKTTVVMSVDLPYDVSLYPEADAILAVYGCSGTSLDPTEALLGGITESKTACGPNITAGVEVAFGVFGASGILPVNVPVLDKESGNYRNDLAYARGYGLTYGALDSAFVDKSALRSAVFAARKLDRVGYTDDSLRAFDTALGSAEVALKNVNAGKAEIFTALDRLQSATRALEKKTEPLSPQTGDLSLMEWIGADRAVAVLCACVAALALAAVTAFAVRRKNEN